MLIENSPASCNTTPQVEGFIQYRVEMTSSSMAVVNYQINGVIPTMHTLAQERPRLRVSESPFNLYRYLPKPSAKLTLCPKHSLGLVSQCGLIVTICLPILA